MYNLTELKNNIFNYFYKNNVDDIHIQSLINTNVLSKESSDNIYYLWDDIKELQNNKQLTPIHLNESYNRLCIISYGYACKNSKYYRDLNVLNLIIKSLRILSRYYNSKTKIIGNWWEWRIGIPYNYSLICLFTDYIDNNYESAMNRFIKRYIKTCDLTYANLASLCRNIYIAGSILNDDGYINTSINSSTPAFNSKSISQIKTSRFLQKLYCRCKWLPYSISMFAGKEGIFDDYSFIQHTSIPYIGTYGIEIIQFAALLYKTNKNTNIKIHNDIQKQLPIWVSAYNTSIYNNEVMVMYCGRSIDKYDVKGAAYNIRKYINEIEEPCGTLNKANSELNCIVINQPISDKLIYDYYDNWRFAISMCSDRVAKYESFNNQNTKGWYQNLGMTYLYTPNKSYQGYIGRVSPYFLPGVTCSSRERNIIESKHPRFNYTNKDIELLRSGSCVVDKHHVTSMLQVNDEYVFAKKSWFIIDDRIICIGTGLQGDNLHTTIYNDSDKIYNINNRNKYIENIGTIVSKNFDLDDTEKGIVKINNISNNYEYSIIPTKKVNNEYPYQNLNIYYDDNIHYIYDSNSKVYLINVWKPYHISNEHYDIEIDTMCSIGLKQNLENIELSISDICQDNNKINIILLGEYKCKDKNCKVKYFYKNNNIYTKLTINCKDKLGETQRFILEY